MSQILLKSFQNIRKVLFLTHQAVLSKEKKVIRKMKKLKKERKSQKKDKKQQYFLFYLSAKTNAETKGRVFEIKWVPSLFNSDNNKAFLRGNNISPPETHNGDWKFHQKTPKMKRSWIFLVTMFFFNWKFYSIFQGQMFHGPFVYFLQH